MRFRLAILLFLFTCPSQNAWPKPASKIDSLISLLPSLQGEDKLKTLLKIGTTYGKENNRKAVDFFWRGLHYANALPNKNWQSVFYRELGRVYRRASSYDSALLYFHKSLTLAVEAENYISIALSSNDVGIIYQHKGKLAEALQLYLRGLKAAEHAHDNDLIGDAYNNIGFIYKGEEDFDRAKEYFEKSLAIRRELNDSLKIAGTLNNIGITLMAQEKYKEARAYYEKAIALLGSEKNLPPSFAAMLYNNFGITFENEGDFDRAFEYYLKSIRIKQQLGDKRGIASTYGNMGANFRKARRWDEAIRYSKLSFNMAKESNSLEQMFKAAKNLSLIYEIQKNYKSAFIYHKQFKELQDSIFNENKAEEIAEMMSAYESEKKDQENKLLKKDAALKGEMLKNQQYLTISLVLGLVLILVLATIFYTRQRKKAELEKLHMKLSLQNAKAETDRALAELTHSQEQLQAHTIRLLENSKLLEELREQLEITDYDADEQHSKLRVTRLNSLIQSRLLTDDDWNRFRELFEKVYPGFFARLRNHFDDLTPAEIRLLALVRLQLNTKEIATMLGISAQTVYKTRQRLRLKIGNSAEKMLSDLELVPL